MTTKPSRHPLALATLGTLVLASVVFACSAPTPTNANTGPAPRTEGASSSAGAPTPSKFFEFKIDKPATIKPGQPSPRYPDALREQHIEGEVVAAFVVDTTGYILPGSFKVLSSTDEAFTKAVWSALPNLQFTPAEVSGHKVRQLLKMPFNFSLSK